MLFEILTLFFFLVQFLVVLSPSGCFEILLPFSSQVKIWAISGMLGHSRVLWEHTTFFLARLGLWDFWLFLLSTSAWRVFQLFTRWSVPLWFHVVFGALKSVRDLATFSCNLQACLHYIFFLITKAYLKVLKSLTIFFLVGPLKIWHLIVWDFTTFFLASRNLSIFWYFGVLLGSLTTYNLYPRKSGPVQILVVFALWQVLEIFQPFSRCLDHSDFW